MPEPERVCGRSSFLPSANVSTTRPPGIGRPSGAVRVGPSKYAALSDLPSAQLYGTDATGVWAWAAHAANDSDAATPALSNMVSPRAISLPDFGIVRSKQPGSYQSRQDCSPRSARDGGPEKA